jgi:hypothetical protein
MLHWNTTFLLFSYLYHQTQTNAFVTHGITCLFSPTYLYRRLQIAPTIILTGFQDRRFRSFVIEDTYRPNLINFVKMFASQPIDRCLLCLYSLDSLVVSSHGLM